MPRSRRTIAACCFTFVCLVMLLAPSAAGGSGGAARQSAEGQRSAVGQQSAEGQQSDEGQNAEYVVLYRDDATPAAAHAAVGAAGGELISENSAIGLALVRSSKSDFVSRVAAQTALSGAAHNDPLWKEPSLPAKPDGVEPAAAPLSGTGSTPAPDTAALAPVADLTAPPTAEPLASKQWDMAMIGASDNGAFRTQLGDRRVRVGVIDTGIDATHPDIAPNFDPVLSRNFTTDIPAIDGPCEQPSCVDPANVDEAGHGTHVAGTIAAALNGVGTAGVAPGVTLVNLRAGQDSAFFFLKPTIDAITYAADNGINVVNMSFFTDPWLYNCRTNPADTATEQLEQRTVIDATQKAVDYAWNRGVTLVAALGNEHTDLGRKSVDTTSPDYPDGAAQTRTVDSSCITVPAELPHVISVAALGPSGKKADYSNYGLAANALSAPGGFLRDLSGTTASGAFSNEILAPYPASVLQKQGLLDPSGAPRTPDVIGDCTGGTCAYWRYLQGTSMASPHVAGVAALIVSQFGTPDPTNDRLTMAPEQVERILRSTATKKLCPGPVISYAAEGRDASYDALCEGDASHNSIYGDGIVNATAALTWTTVASPVDLRQ